MKKKDVEQIEDFFQEIEKLVQVWVVRTQGLPVSLSAELLFWDFFPTFTIHMRKFLS